MSLPPLSIVIPSHSRADLLRLCLASVTRFAPTRTEIIVLDDGSPDAVVSRVAGEFSGVIVIRRPQAGGFCAAANAGLAAASAHIVELLNDDTEVTPHWADAALSWFDDPQVGAVAPLVLQNDPGRRVDGRTPLIDSTGDEYDPGGFAKKRGRGLPWLPADMDHPLTHPGPVWGVSACAGFYRRDAVLRAGGFPEHFIAYFEDVDLSFRIRGLGLRIIYEPGSVVWHRVSASYGGKPSRRILEQQSCNEERVFWRNLHGLDRIKHLPRHAAVLTAKAARRLQERAFLPWFLGRVRAIAGR